ncbi:uncharacterized protein LOC108043562 [Drosophila rhopaloa]|uniref:Uncharacterized protein LOC108043562 n=1 Tax=Drosophila rhopaloa TaxID=1041015 RepID=A0A6P4EI06_DRORH|nr:uncharacterized protein LOC108043562 [Drosophila rhopaloa]XP_016977815.1 uncharacterized protein LOC108043562 [Drosophila rhopaloa]
MMNDPWREIGFVSTGKPKKHLPVIQMKKRIKKCRNIFKQRQKELILLHLKNRIMYLIIENLFYRLAKKKPKKRVQKLKVVTK